jgi:uncharacterized phage infection (PIP) family protein YhgE
VGLLQELENKALELISKLLAPVITPLQKLWAAIKNFASALIDVVPETIALVQLIISEVNAWKSFRLNVNTKGVVNLKSAQDRIQQLLDEIVAGWRALEELFTSGFKLPLKSINEMAEAAEEVATAFEEFFGKFGLREFIGKIVPKLEKAGGKVLEILALIEAVAEEALKVVRELHDIVQALKDIRETFETGEGLFLSQKNPRKILTLNDGSTIKIRVGNLHS